MKSFYNEWIFPGRCFPCYRNKISEDGEVLPPPTFSEMMRSEEKCSKMHLVIILNTINFNLAFSSLNFLFRFEAENAKNDENAPSFCFGRIRGYFAFDTGKDTHYYWYLNHKVES